MKYKKRFYRVYDKLPEAEKKNVVYLLKSKYDDPMSWIAVELEVRKETRIGKEALNWLVKQEII